VLLLLQLVMPSLLMRPSLLMPSLLTKQPRMREVI
jgi:hypothetical protein